MNENQLGKISPCAKRLALRAALLCLVAAAMIPVNIGNAKAIVGGSEVSHEGRKSRFSSLFSLVTKSSDCGATYIGSTGQGGHKLLTAAHCLAYPSTNTLVPLSTMAVEGRYLTRSDPDAGVNVLRISSALLHPDYKPWLSRENDLAILYVKGDLGDATAAHLPTDATPSGEVATTAGWGLEAEDKEPPEKLRSVTLKTLDQQECVEKSAPLLVTQNMLCAGPLDGSSAQGGGLGDSGGPLLVGDTLVGVLSWGLNYPVVKEGDPTVFTRVSSYIDWINQAPIPAIDVGEAPNSVVVNSEGTEAYTANLHADAVSVVSIKDNRVVATIAVGKSPSSLALTADGKFLYVTNSESDTLSLVDLTARKVVKEIAVGEGPEAVSLAAGGTLAFVANYRSDTVSVVETSAQSVIKNLPVGASPTAVSSSPDGKHVYVANADSATVSIIDASLKQTIGNPIQVGVSPSSIVASPDGKNIYVADRDVGTILKIDTVKQKVVGKPIWVGSSSGIALSPDGLHLFVALEDSDVVAMVDTSTGLMVGRPVSVGSVPCSVALSSDDQWVYVANRESSTISVISADRFGASFASLVGE